MDPVSILMPLVLIVGFYMAWNIGANDVSNAMGTSVGSRALTLKQAVIIAAVLEFAGAFFMGANVSETMQKGILDVSDFINDPLHLAVGMCAALIGTGIWLQLASYFGWPVSTTHAIVGSIIGFGLVSQGAGGIQWKEVSSIAVSWVLSPTISALLSYLLFVGLQKKILYAMNPIVATKRLMPYIVGFVLAIFTFSFLFGGLKNLDVELNFPSVLTIALVVGLISYLVSYLLMKRIRTPKKVKIARYSPQMFISLSKAIKHLNRARVNTTGESMEKIHDILREARELSSTMVHEKPDTKRPSEYRLVEKLFVFLQVITACFIAFAHGANDVANAIGPVAAVFQILKKGNLLEAAPIPAWLLILGGSGIVIGLATWGWRVIETIGRKITELTPTRGFCAEFGAATTILWASKLGLPISTTHCLVGAVMGIGLAGGIKALNLSTLRDIGLSWLITLPASALMSIIAYYLLSLFLL